MSLSVGNILYLGMVVAVFSAFMVTLLVTTWLAAIAPSGRTADG